MDNDNDNIPNVPPRRPNPKPIANPTPNLTRPPSGLGSGSGFGSVPRPKPLAPPPSTPTPNLTPRSRPKSEGAVERDGVVYIPSSIIDDDSEESYAPRPKRPSGSPQTKGNPNLYRAGNASSERARREAIASGRGTRIAQGADPTQGKTKFAIMFIAIVTVIVIATVVAFSFVFNSLTGGKKPKQGTDPFATPTNIASSESPTPPVNTSTSTDEIQAVAIIKGISEDSRRVELYDMEKEKSYNVYVDKATELKDKYDTLLVFAEFKVGDIVEVAMLDGDPNLKSMRMSALGWSNKSMTNVKINMENQTIGIGNDLYTYANDLLVFYNGKPYELAKIDSKDVMTVNGFHNKAFFLSLEKTHGFLKINENKDIINGTVEVDTAVYTLMDAAKEVSILEGKHRVVVKGNNIEPIDQEIEVKAGETVTLDLTDVEFKAGILTFAIREGDATITVNGEKLAKNEPLALPYGKYNVVVEKEGYETWKSEVELKEPTQIVSVEMTQKVQLYNFTVVTSPLEANVFIDGVYVGLSPASVTTEEGAHTITYEKTGYKSVTFSIKVAEGFVPPIVTLQPEELLIP